MIEKYDPVQPCSGLLLVLSLNPLPILNGNAFDGRQGGSLADGHGQS